MAKRVECLMMPAAGSQHQLFTAEEWPGHRRNPLLCSMRRKQRSSWSSLGPGPPRGCAGRLKPKNVVRLSCSSSALLQVCRAADLIISHAGSTLPRSHGAQSARWCKFVFGGFDEGVVPAKRIGNDAGHRALLLPQYCRAVMAVTPDRYYHNRKPSQDAFSALISTRAQLPR